MGKIKFVLFYSAVLSFLQMEAVAMIGKDGEEKITTNSTIPIRQIHASISNGSELLITQPSATYVRFENMAQPAAPALFENMDDLEHDLRIGASIPHWQHFDEFEHKLEPIEKGFWYTLFTPIEYKCVNCGTVIDQRDVYGARHMETCEAAVKKVKCLYEEACKYDTNLPTLIKNQTFPCCRKPLINWLKELVANFEIASAAKERTNN